MKLSLISLRLKNFKGIKAFVLNPDSKDLTIAGNNGSGKTTVYDAFNWLFFGKDSQGKADFQIKPVDEDGAENHNLDSEVEGNFYIDGTTLSLMRRFKEKYTKKRGEAKKSFTGHTTEYFIDGVPAKDKEFKAKIEDVIDIDKFKLITNPFEFNTIPWEKRRNILFEMCGDVDNQAVIDSNKDLESLSEILKSCSVGDHKKKIAAKKRELNKHIEEIPIKIQEHKLINDVPQPDPKEMISIENKISEYREKLNEIVSNESLSKKRVRINEIDAEIAKAIGDAQKDHYEKQKPTLEIIHNLESERRTINNSIEDFKGYIERDLKRNKISQDSLNSLRAQWKMIKMAGNKPIETDCPTCGQNLQEDKIKEAQAKFNKANADRLEANQKEGKGLKMAYDARVIDIEANKARIIEELKKLPGIDDKILAKKESLKDCSLPVDTTLREKEKEMVQYEITSIEEGSTVLQNEYKEKLGDLGCELKKLQEFEASYQAAKDSRKRIEDLKEQEKILCKEFEKLEKELFIVEQFIISKVEMVEENINSRFELAKFKLFRKQINGGVEPCCETLHNGVPYNHGLNNAARINVGLDIINAISGHYGFMVPVFIDNSESVNEIIPMDTQLISLQVSKDKELTITN